MQSPSIATTQGARVDQSYQMTTGEALRGLFGGLVGALLAAPCTGGASAAAGRCSPPRVH